MDNQPLKDGLRLLLCASVLLFTQVNICAAGIQPVSLRSQQWQQQLYCLTCPLQTVADSDSDFSNNMRAYLEEKINQGWSDEQIKHNLISNYGQGIIKSEHHYYPWQWLWGLFCLIIMIFWMRYRKQSELP